MFITGKYMDDYFVDREIGYCETLEQIVDRVKFFMHCQKEDKYATKIKLCHGVLIDVEDHETQ